VVVRVGRAAVEQAAVALTVELAAGPERYVRMKLHPAVLKYVLHLQRQKETDPAGEKYAQQEGHGALDEYHLHLSSPRYRQPLVDRRYRSNLDPCSRLMV